jgi:hypothetical protein
MQNEAAFFIDRLTSSIVAVNSGESFETDILLVGTTGCKMSFELGFDGFVAFNAKTSLVQHYVDSLGAQVLNKYNRMGIFTPAAKKLVSLYYKEFLNERQS